jgi:transposase
MGKNVSKIEKVAVRVSNPRTKYDADFKRQVLDVWNSGTYTTIVECAKNYGIKENTLYNWLHQAKKSPVILSSNNSEIVNLKKELSRAKMELEILKKAAIYFANHAR